MPSLTDHLHRRQHLAGPLLMVAATATFTVMIALVKAARVWDHGTLELMGWRSLLGIPALYLVSRSWKVHNRRLVALRCTFGFAAMFCYYSATTGLGIGELSILTKLQPLLIAFVAPLALGRAETPTRSTWGALALGLSGTLVIAMPALDGNAVRLWSVVAGLGAAVFSTFAHTCLRGLRDESPAAVVFWFQLAVGLAVVAGLVGTNTTPVVPSVYHLPALAGIGLCAVAGQLLMTRAYSIASAPRVAAAGYAGPLLGFALDATVFGTPPTLESLVGSGLILGAGWLLLRGA